MNLVVLSGGTATNSITSCLYNLTAKENKQLTFILPISDNGGSTSEILRVLGGPAIGDIRSRIVRLLEDDQLINIFSYRLPDNLEKAKLEWNEFVEGSHKIWSTVPISVKEMIRPFIIHIQSELLKRNRNSQNNFKFEKASIGNLFLTGSRLFLGNLDAAIELMMRLGRCNPYVSVMPCINTSHTHHISALLSNGDVITGQSQISHPSKPSINRVASRNAHELLLSNNSICASFNSTLSIGSSDAKFLDIEPKSAKSILNSSNLNEFDDSDDDELANPRYILPELRNSQLHFDKQDMDQMLPAPIERILYINPYGEEVKPTGNLRAINKIKACDILLYSIGSLMTSLMPILILGNIANTILETKDISKVLIVNNKYDRETYGLDAINYVKFIIDSMIKSVADYRQSKNMPINNLFNVPWSSFITDIIYLTKGDIQMDWQVLRNRGINIYSIDSDLITNEGLKSVLNKIKAEKKA